METTRWLNLEPFQLIELEVLCRDGVKNKIAAIRKLRDFTEAQERASLAEAKDAIEYLMWELKAGEKPTQERGRISRKGHPRINVVSLSLSNGIQASVDMTEKISLKEANGYTITLYAGDLKEIIRAYEFAHMRPQ